VPFSSYRYCPTTASETVDVVTPGCPAVADCERRLLRGLGEPKLLLDQRPLGHAEADVRRAVVVKAGRVAREPRQQPHLRLLVLVEEREGARLRLGRRQLDAGPGSLADDLLRERLAFGGSENSAMSRKKTCDATFDELEVVDDLLFTSG
jgi:hypothetical protein